MAILRIELLEDCEMNSGRAVNTYFADDVFFDAFGMPYIPAWVIANSLLKAIEGLEAQPENQELAALLRGQGSLVLDDALIADRESMRQAILDNPFKEHLLRNSQSVLNGSGFTRIEQKSSLSGDVYVRMLAKGTIFEAPFEVGESHKEVFIQAISQLKVLFLGHMVRARFSVDEAWNRPQFDVAKPAANFDGERCRLEYDLHVLSRAAALDHISGELSATPYVPGAVVRESLANRAELSGVFAGRDNAVNCSFAYIDADGHRGLPIPASYSTKKQDKTDLRDRCSLGRRPDDYDQIKGMGTLFIDDADGAEIHAMSVRKEQGILQTYENGTLGNRYYTAIGAGQTFKGFIEGPTAEVQRIFNSLCANGYVRVGDLSNLGFGNTFIQVKQVEPVQASEPVMADEITVLLVSTARLHHGGIYEPSAQSVREEIQAKLGPGIELEIVRNSQKTCEINIYNKAWGEFEPLEYGMKAGSIYRMRAKDGGAFDVSPALGSMFIGGNNDAGYGEVLVLPAVDIYYRKISYADLPEESMPLSYRVDPNPGRRLMRGLFQANANRMASHLGAAQAEQFVNGEFHEGPLAQIHRVLGDDFSQEQVFLAYVDALKESGLNAIRRGRND